MNLNNKNIIISRSDSIGDVILTLPLVGFLKEKYPSCTILFLGKKYTKEILATCSAVDVFINLDEIKDDLTEELKKHNADIIIHVFPNKEIAKAAKAAKIPNRIGTSHRFFHRFTCNNLVNFTRKNSDLHEAQLNFKLLKPLGIDFISDLKQIPDLYNFNQIKALKSELSSLLKTEKKGIILHPGSKGSAREWGIDRFTELIELLPQNNFQVFLTGTEQEGQLFRKELLNASVIDLSGKLSLSELISFIANSDTLIAASTGPLHIAAAAGINAVGIFPPIRPMHPGRWAPLGNKTKVFVAEKECNDCRKKTECACMRSITAEEIASFLMK